MAADEFFRDLRRLERSVDKLGWRVSALDEWRRETDMRISRCVERIDGLSKADEIAAAVSEQVRRDGGLVLTGLQKTCAAVLGAVVLADSIKGLF